MFWCNVQLTNAFFSRKISSAGKSYTRVTVLSVLSALMAVQWAAVRCRAAEVARTDHERSCVLIPRFAFPVDQIMSFVFAIVRAERSIHLLLAIACPFQ